MNTILIFMTAVAAAVADVHELLKGYHYDKPITSYGVPSFTVLNKYNTGLSTDGSNILNTGFGSILGTVSPVQPVRIGNGPGYTFGGSLGQTNGGPVYPLTGSSGQIFETSTAYPLTGSSGQIFETSTVYPLTGSSGQIFDTSTVYPLTGSSGQIFGTSTVYPLTGSSGQIFDTGNSGLLTGLSGGYQQTSSLDSNAGYQHSQNNYQSNAGNYQSQHNFIHSGPPEVYKHVYVHTAPQEPERPKAPKSIVLPPKQKHYNIIFVKAPTPAAGASQVIPVQQESEEKTIVYVLVQKPEEIKDVVLPQLAPKQPSKPEVFFIKYDGKDDAHGVIDNIVNDYQKHDSVSFNGIGVNHNELSGDNVVIHENLLNTYGTPLSSSDNQYVSSTEGISSIPIVTTSTVGPILIETSTPQYNIAGSTSNGFLSTSGINDFETGNEITIGSSNTGSGKYVVTSSGEGQINDGKFGGPNSYQTIQIETSNADTTSNGLNSIETSTIKPIEFSSVGPTSTLAALVTGNDIISTTLSPVNIFDPISTGLNVPFETYGPPQFKP